MRSLTRRQLIAAASFAPMLSLASCSSAPETVPDSLVQMYIDDCIAAWNYYDCDSVETEIEHEADKENHMDSVTVVFRFRYPYGYLERKTEGLTYQYDRSSDLWNTVSDGQHYGSVVWENLEQFYGTYSYAQQLYGDYSEASVTIDDIDTDIWSAEVSGYFEHEYMNIFAETKFDTIPFGGTVPVDLLSPFGIHNNSGIEVDYRLEEYLDSASVVWSDYYEGLGAVDRALLRIVPIEPSPDSGWLTPVIWISLKRGILVAPYQLTRTDYATTYFVDGPTAY